MKRRYNRGQALANIQRIRGLMPGVMFTADLMVGFPGESEEDFLDTVNFVREARLLDAHVFAYSKREGTPAAEYADQVPPEVQSERFSRLLKLQHAISNENNHTIVGNIKRVLVEGISKNDPSMYTGRCESGRLVHFMCDTDYTGKIVNIKIDRAETFNVFGTVVE
jgi:tRNA-2-methylthio-N6-dimethylallyladenosine synthase